MGLDYGSKTVGVAMTDPTGLIVQPVETIERKSENKLRKTLARLEILVQEYQVEKIVLGLPVHMDGSAGERVMHTIAFKERLEARIPIPVEMQDERLTTFAADEDLQQMNIPKQERKKYIDQIAAVYILEDYLHMHGGVNMENKWKTTEKLS